MALALFERTYSVIYIYLVNAHIMRIRDFLMKQICCAGTLEFASLRLHVSNA